MYSVLQTSLFTLTYARQTCSLTLRSQKTQENHSEVVQAATDVLKISVIACKVSIHTEF